jgi:hypothetical protein
MKISAHKTSCFYALIGLLLIAACSEPKAEKSEPKAEKEEVNTGFEDTKIEKEESAHPALANSIADVGIDETIEAAGKIVDAGKNLVEAKRKNDSILESKREKMFAYQLGVPMKSKDQVVEAYEKLSDTKGVYVLKKSRKEYVLVKYEDKPESQVDEELQDYKDDHAEEVIGEIKKVDLVKECGKRKKPVLSSRIKKRKDDTQIDCLTCD